MEGLKSIDTTMGYTPAGGILMGTRSGNLDRGVILELAKNYDSEALSDLVYHRKGLLVLSAGESSEIDHLLERSSEDACFAVSYFCR
jgi:acetate kinase